MEQDDRLAEAFHFFVRLLADRVPVFPVEVRPYVDILDAGIVEIPRQMLLGSFFLDLLEDADLVLGQVGLDGLVVVRPESGQGVAVLVFGVGMER